MIGIKLAIVYLNCGTCGNEHPVRVHRILKRAAQTDPAINRFIVCARAKWAYTKTNIKETPCAYENRTGKGYVSKTKFMTW
jgi:hypothetical protein